MSAGQLFRQALIDASPLQIVGTINAYTAIMAKQIGHKAKHVTNLLELIRNIYR